MTHTPGPWDGDTNFPDITKIDDERGTVIDIATVYFDDGGAGLDCAVANARLIAAAPDGYAAACDAYSFLLSLPIGESRIRAQGVMCRLRDYIASVTGKSVEDTQNEYELQAVAKATGGD